jgi:hypothetical protein
LPLTVPPLPTGTLASVLEGGETDFLAGLDTAMGGCGVGTLVRVANGGVDVDGEDPEATFLIELDSDTGEEVRCGMRMFAFDWTVCLARPGGKDTGPAMVVVVYGTANDGGGGGGSRLLAASIGAGPVTSVSGVGGGTPRRSASVARRWAREIFSSGAGDSP